MERRTRPSGMLELGATFTDVAWTVACGTEPFHDNPIRGEIATKAATQALASAGG